MEILFPDVVGSGGAPKRITKPRRKGFEPMQDSDELDGSGSNVMDLLSPGNSSMLLPTSQTPIHPPTVPSNGTVRPASTMQNRQSIASATALTPPDDEPQATSGHSRKRQTDIGMGQRGKRRRTGNNNYIDLTHSAQMLNIDPSIQNDSMLANTYQGARQANDVDYAPGVPGGLEGAPSSQLAHDVVMAIGDAARSFSKAGGFFSANRWTEHAMEILFRDFSEEDPDLQLKIGEKVLCDSNKATMFCMMPEPLRQHWVKKLREVHNRLDVSLSSNMNSNQATMNGSNGLMNGGGMPGMMQMNGPINGGGMGRNGSQVG